jgi:Bacterial membrane protein YfhO
MTQIPSVELPSKTPAPVSQDRSFSRRDLGAMALLAGLVVFLFWKALFTSDLLFYRDIFNYSYPHARLIREICRSGHLPYWNPYLDFGQPLLANPNTLFFYPFTLFMVLLPLKIAYPLHYVVHISLAGIGTYWLARRWQQSRLAAFFAGGFLALSGPVLSLGNFYNLSACAAWIPWALLLTDRAVEERSWRPWLLLTLVFSLQFLAGEPMTLMATFGLATAYAFWRKGNLRRPFSWANFRLLLCFFGVGSAMVALAAVALLPSLHLLFNSRRGNGLTFWQAGYWSLHPLSLLAVVLPQFFGSSLESATIWKLVLNSRAVPLLLSYFVGFIPLFFALLGGVMGRDARRRFVVLAGIALLILALGRFTPVFAAVYYAIPLFRLVRFPVKFLIPAVLMMALLAGWGLDALPDFAGQPRGRRKRILVPLGVVLAAALAVVAIAFVEPRWITAPAAWVLVHTNNLFAAGPTDYLHADQVSVALAYLLMEVKVQFPQLIALSLGGILWLLALERGKRVALRAAPWVAAAGLLLLVRVNYGVNPTVPGSFYTYRPPVLEHFQKTEEPYRFCYLGPERPHFPTHPSMQDFVSFANVPAAAGLSPSAVSLFREKILLHFGSMLTGQENASNNDVDASLPHSFADFWTYLRQKGLSRARYHCLLGRANVRYLVSRSRDDSAAVRRIAEVDNGSIEPSYLYEDLCLSPRAYAVASAVYSPGVKETLDRLSDPQFDALGQVILAGPPEPAPAEPPAPAGTVKIVRRQASRVTLEADLSRPGYVVLLDRYDPDWHATLDGQPVAILRANQMFRAVRCGPGRHTIDFTYRQSGLEAGFGISLASLIVLGILYGLDPKFRRKAPPAQPLGSAKG